MGKSTTYTLSLLIAVFFSLCTSCSHPVYPPVEEQRTKLSRIKKIPAPRLLDSSQIINDLRFLSSDTCEGRQAGLKGHELAVDRILLRMREAGLDSFNKSLLQSFPGKKFNNSIEGKNIIGWVKGAQYPDRYIVISAHYDHMGFDANGEIFHGASDNASGTACLLAMANYFKQHPHPYSLIFAAFDREESGEEGAFYFVKQALSEDQRLNIRFNLNIDMIARNDQNEIFVCGLIHYPSFAYLVKDIQPKTTAKILMGHDSGPRSQDWTFQSDHYAFYKNNIPFLYLGVEDHPDYHRTTDTFDKIDLPTYIENCNMILSMANLIDL